MEKTIREIIEIHTYFLMSFLSSLLMIDYCVLSSPQWCSGESSELTPWRPGFKSGLRPLMEDTCFHFMRIITSSITIVTTSFSVVMVH
jgi:hypothetical protein